MNRLLQVLWQHRNELCLGRGTEGTMGKILDAHFGEFHGSQALRLQRLCIDHLNELSEEDLRLLQQLIPHVYPSSYSQKAWFVPVSRAAKGDARKKRFLRIADDTAHRALVRHKLELKNKHRISVNALDYLQAMTQWSKSDALEAKMACFLAAVGCRRCEMIDPFILFQFERDCVSQLGVHKSKRCVTLQKKCLLPGMAKILDEIRAENLGHNLSRKEMGDLAVWPRVIALIRTVIPTATCHTLRSLYVALTYDEKSSFTSHAQSCCGHSSLNTALHYQGVRLL